MDVLRLVLVDDYRMVTEAMASRLSASPDLWVAGCSQTDDPRLPEIIRWLRPDVVLIDVEPLGIAIAEVLGRIREAWPAARIIVVSADTDPGHAVEAARAGADAWVSKNQGADQLETVVRGVARGQSWYPPQMLGAVLRALRDDVRSAQESSSLLDSLSPREMDVLTSMAKGKRARQIAAELTISADTVRTHTRSIFGKLEVHSRIEAVRVAWAAGLRPPDAPGPSAAAPRDPSRRDPARPARPPSSAPAAPDQLSPAPPVSGQPGSGRLGSDQPGSGRPGSDQRGSGRPESGRPAPARHGSGPTGPAAVSGGTPEARRRRLPSTFRTRPGTPPEPRSS